MRKIFSLFVASILLAGCSVDTITSKPPIFTGKSPKNPAAVVRCLAPKMSDLNPSATTMETETGYRIVVSVSDVGASVVALVDADGEGSEVRMHAFTAGYRNPWGKMAMACL